MVAPQSSQTYIWKGKDCPTIDPVEVTKPVGGITGLAPKYEICYRDYGSDSRRCLPERKPNRCGLREYNELLKQIFA